MSTAVMNIYSRALEAFLDKQRNPEAPTQADFAGLISRTQAAVSRYASGRRLPPRGTAEKIDQATKGRVSLALWMTVAAERAGIAA